MSIEAVEHHPKSGRAFRARRRRATHISPTAIYLHASNHAAEAARLHTRHFGQK